MPLRSPKMYFCIFGFQRLVWWPKCTPASSSSFMVRVAMVLPSFPSSFGWPPVPTGRPPEREAALPRSADAADGDRSSEPRVLGRVLRSDSKVLLAEIRCPHRVFAAPESQVDGDGVARAAHPLVDAVDARAGARHALLPQRLVADRDGHPVRGHPRGALAQRHHDAPPAGVGAVDGGLDQRRGGPPPARPHPP